LVKRLKNRIRPPGLGRSSGIVGKYVPHKSE